MKKILITLLIFGMIFSLAGVMAGQNKYTIDKGYSEQDMKQIQNQFQNRYQFECPGECTYFEGDKFENLQLEVKQQKRFLFFNVNAKETYVFSGDESGEIIQTRYNLWSRLLNQERIRI